MASQASGGAFKLNVLNPGGRDPDQQFADLDQNAQSRSALHAPVNFHAYAACTGGSFFRSIDRAVAANAPTLLLLRGDFRASERALLALKKARVPVAISLKETGMHQIAEQLRDRSRLERFLRILVHADGCIAPTLEAAEFYNVLRGNEEKVTFVPTPYPVHDPRWDFSQPINARRGIFVGTREWQVPSRNHAAALFAARRISDETGEPVTVYNVDGRKGKHLLDQLGFASERLEVLEGAQDYFAYLRVVARHKLVFQLDASSVPGQVAGDALLCRLPCVGGHGTVERLAFAELCGRDRNVRALIELAVRLLQDETFARAAIDSSQAGAHERLSFGRAADELQKFFGRL
jgi:hypothetical protein